MAAQKQNDFLKQEKQNRGGEYTGKLICSVILSLPVSLPMFLYSFGVSWPLDISVSSIFFMFNYVMLKGN